MVASSPWLGFTVASRDSGLMSVLALLNLVIAS